MIPEPSAAPGVTPAETALAPAPAGPQPGARPPARESLWLNLGFNAVAPALILAYLSERDRLGPGGALVLALLFPLGYGIWDVWKRRTWNLFVVLGLTGTLITGGLGLMKMSGFWFAVKEAVVPLLLGAAIPWSLRTRQPLVKTLLYNDQFLNTARIQTALEARNRLPEFDRLLARTSWVLGAALVVSSVVNFVLAWWLLPAVSGTDEFNRQLAKLQFWSWPGSFVPLSIGMFYGLFGLMKGIETLTELPGKELFHGEGAGR